jgi:methionyl-tRNA formyltransferase
MARKPTKDLSVVNWNSHSALELNRIQRAIGVRYPLTTTFRGSKIHLIDVKLSSHPDGVNLLNKGGSFTLQERPNPKILIKTAQGWLECSKLKVSGKRPIEVKDFVNGYLPDPLRDFFGS